VLTSARRRLEADSKAFGLGPRVVAALLLVPLVGGLLLAAARADLSTFRALTKEDGPIEWLQVLAFLGTSLLAAGTGLRLVRRGDRIPGLLFLALAGACVFIAGEEIAWGERLLHLEVPEAIEDLNDQEELTVHNIGLLLYVFNAGMLLVATYGVTSPFLVLRLGERLPSWWRRYLVPPMALASAFGVAVVFRLVRFTLVRHSGFTITKWGEWAELCLASAMFTFALLSFRRVQRPEPVAPAEAAPIPTSPAPAG
jgi:hypothetical protein